MKKFFYTVLAASMLFATSCSHEEIVDIIKGEGQKVTFKVNLPEQATSRAVADGSKANKLIYAMYESGTTENAEEALICGVVGNRDDNGNFTVTVPMAKDIEYDLLFLAYNEEKCAFGIADEAANTDLRALQFKSSLHANEDAYDAFVGKLLDNRITDTKEVELTRPFAQVNAATTNTDWAIADETLKSAITHSYLHMSGVPSAYNVFEGKAFGNLMEVDFIKSESPIDVTLNGYSNYKYLTFAYVLAGDDNTQSTATAQFEFYRANGKKVSSLVLPNFPLERNHRTNVIGSLLTQYADYKVSIDASIGGDEKVEADKNTPSVKDVQTPEQWAEVAALLSIPSTEPISIKLGGNNGRSANDNGIVVNVTANIHKNNTVFLDLNGYNLSYAVTNDGASAIINNKGTLNIINTGENKNAMLNFVADNPDMQEIPSYATNTITNTGTLTIGENVTVTNESDGGASYAVDNHGTFTLNGGTLIGNRCALRVAKYNQDNVQFTMNSGLIEASTPTWIQLPGSDTSVAPNITVDIKGGTMQSTNASSAENNVMYTYSHGNSHANTVINISGGNFMGGTVSIGAGYKGDAPTLNITGGTFEYDVLKWLENDEYEVLYSARREISTAEDLLALGGKSVNGTYSIVNNIDLAGAAIPTIGAAYGKSLTIIGNGHTISNAVTAHTSHNGMKHHGLFYAYTNSKLTINDLVIENVNIDATKDTERNYGAAVVVAYADGGSTVTLNNVDVKNCMVVNNHPDLGDEAGVYVGYQTGTLNMTDCNSTGCSVAGETDEKTGAFIGMVNGTANLTNCTTDLTIGACNRVAGTLNIDGTVQGNASNQDELNQAVAFGNDIMLTLKPGEYTIPNVSSQVEKLTIKGSENTVINAQACYVENTKLVFEGVTIKIGLDYAAPGASDYAGIYSPNATFTKCHFVGGLRVGRSGANFEECKFTLEESDYVYTYGNSVEFNKCIFDSKGKALIVYSDGNGIGRAPKVKVTNCEFNATQKGYAYAIANQQCAAVEIDNFGCGVELTLSGNTIDDDFSGLWRIKSYYADKNNAVTINGTEYTSIALDGKTMTIDANRNVTVAGSEQE